MDRDEELNNLTAENKKLKKKVNKLKATIKITTQHGDATTVFMEQKVSDSEKQYKCILNAMPIPVIIAKKEGGRILHVNQRACVIFGYEYKEFLQQHSPALYEKSQDRDKFVNLIEQQDKVNDFEVRLKKLGNTLFWASLSSVPINFQDELCLLTVVYDLTERKQTEEKIRKLQEQLDIKEEKYLTFTLAGEEYGIHILDVSEIVRMMPVTSMPKLSGCAKGVIELRDRVIPVIDLRLRLALETSDYSDKTCIIIVETDKDKEKQRKIFGLIVDTISEVLNVKGRDIQPPPLYGPLSKLDFISGMARSEESVTILLDVQKLLANM